jgi:hypothetical protein
VSYEKEFPKDAHIEASEEDYFIPYGGHPILFNPR